MKIKKMLSVVISFALLMGSVGQFVQPQIVNAAVNPFKYSAIDGGLQITNGQNVSVGSAFYNRPLFGGSHVNDVGNPNKKVFTYTGDKPVFNYIQNAKLANVFFGTKDGKWLHDMDNITASYIWGREEYDITDSTFTGTIKVTFVRATEFDGLLVKITMPDAIKDKLVVVAGGTSVSAPPNSTADYNSAILGYMPFIPANCVTTTVTPGTNSFSVVKTGSTYKNLTGISNIPMIFAVKDATTFATSLTALLNSSSSTTPMAVGTTSGNTANDIYLTFTTEAPTDSKITAYSANVPTNFGMSLSKVEALSKTINIKTPDAYLDSSLTTQVISMDGVVNKPYVMHGATRWHIPFSGWRSRYALSLLDMRDDVKNDAKKYITAQINQSVQPTVPITGRIPAVPEYGYRSNDRYNMGEVFVDQILYYYETTNDIDFMRDFAYDSIKAHLAFQETWMKVPGTNLYENFLNAWNTDNKWANGGVSTISSVYTWRAYEAMAKIATVLNKTDDATGFSSKANAIVSELRPTLWSGETGVFAEYKDFFGLQRLHDSPDLSSIYTPIDMGVTDMFEAYQSIKYNESNIERLDTLDGGQFVYSSNWEPNLYSSKGLFPGEMINLMLSYFQNGQSQGGNTLLKGMEALLFQNHGDMANATDAKYASSGNLDFPDNTSIFIKTITDGLFGIKINAPENKVVIKPAFPKEWNNAEITTPNVSYTYAFNNNTETLTITNPKAFNYNVELPIKTTSVSGVIVNGQSSNYTIKEGLGCSYISLATPADSTLTVVVSYNNGAIPVINYTNVVDGDTTFNFSVSSGIITEIKDPQGVIKAGTANINSANCSAILSSKTGNHTLFAKVDVNGISMWLPIDIKINKPTETLKDIPISDLYPSTVNLDSVVNQDLKNIHNNTYYLDYNNQSDYSLPKYPWSADAHRTVQSFGRSWWEHTMSVPTTITGITGLPEAGGVIDSIANVPFRISNVANKNAVFTSQYNNFPNKVTVPVNKKGQKLYFMLAVSTNHMQSRIENARITVNFKDGTNKILPLTNPDNIDDWLNYSTASSYAKTGIVQPLGAFNGKAHANILNVNIGEEKEISTIDFECLSNEVLAGLLGVTVYSIGVDDKLQEANTLITNAQNNDLSQIYSQQKLVNLQTQKQNLEVIMGGTPTDQQLIDAVALLSTAIDEYKNSSIVTVVYSPADEVIPSETLVILSSNIAGVELYYTTNGSEPTITSTKYTAGFTLPTSTTTVKVAPFYNGILVGKTFSKNYTFSSVNLALNKTASASNEHSAPYPASGAVDGNASTTRWATVSGLDSVSLTVDFGAQTSFNKVVLNEAYFDTTSRIGNLAIQFLGEDGATWRTAYTSLGNETQTITGTVNPKQGVRTITFPTVKSNKVKVILGTVALIGTTVKPGPSLWEFEVYNDLSNKTKNTFAIGDYVQMGSYNNSPIKWRVVDIDANGPLLLSDKVLSMKSYDAAGTSTAGSHARSTTRTTAGSDFWADSNMRSWLQSSSDSVSWACGNAPTTANVRSTNGVAYDTEKGFLANGNFTLTEKNAIKSVTQKAIINGSADSTVAGKNGSTTYAKPAAGATAAAAWASLTTGYSTAYSINLTESMFLLDVKQIQDVYNKSLVLGSSYAVGYRADTNAAVFTWLRTPWANYTAGAAALVVNGSIGTTSVYSNDCYNGNAGVRPAFYIDELKSQIVSGSGTATSPFVINSNPFSRINSLSVASNVVTASIVCGAPLANMIIALYDINSKLVGVSTQPIIANKNDYTFDFTGKDNTFKIKAMIMESANNIKPLAQAKEILR